MESEEEDEQSSDAANRCRFRSRSSKLAFEENVSIHSDSDAEFASSSSSTSPPRVKKASVATPHKRQTVAAARNSLHGKDDNDCRRSLGIRGTFNQEMRRISMTSFAKMLEGDMVKTLGVKDRVREAGSGLVTDYLVRLKGQVAGHLAKNLAALMGPRSQSEKAIQDMGQDAGLICAIADYVTMERLHENLMDDLVVFWKSLGSQGWIEPTRQKILKVSKEVVRTTRMAACLKHEVDTFIARRLMLKRGRREEYVHRREGQVERYCRLQEFWTQAHMDDRKVPPQAISRSRTSLTQSGKPSQKSGGRNSNTSQRSSISSEETCSSLPPMLSSLPGLLRPNSRSDSRPASQPSRPGSRLHSRPASQGSTLSSKLSSTTISKPTESAWKTRGARSHCSFGGWDWAQGSSKVERSVKPSRTTRQDVRTEVIAGHEPPYWRDATVEDMPDSPGKWWSRGSDLSVFLKPKHVKSASAPTLGMHTVQHNLWTGPSDESFRSQSSQTSLCSSREAGHVSAFTEPWKTSDPNLKWMNSPSQKYLRACQKNRKSPKPLPFVTGHSTKLEAGGVGLLDGDLSAITKMTSDVVVEEVELQGNVLLTESSLIPFTESLFGKDVQTLNLKRCVQARDAMLQTLVDLLAHPEGVQRLSILDLSSIPISPKCHLSLCKAIEAHQNLEAVHLAETGLGGNLQAKECIQALFGCKTLKKLGLAWNCFTADTLAHIGQCCVQAEVLSWLDLANCSALTEEGDIAPVVFFLEHLRHDEGLTQLDVSLNRIDYRGALIIEDALLNHKKLKELNLCENPFGLLGMRSLLRLLACDESGLVSFKCDGCSIGSHPQASADEPFFNASNPGGRYNFDLSHPYSRSLLRMLYRTCRRLSISADSALTDMYYSQHGYHVKHDPVANSMNVPDYGRLQVTFSLERATEGALKEVDERDFSQFLAAHNSIMRMQPGFKKVIPICAQWKSLEGRVQEQLIFINALSKDFILTYPHIKEFSRSRGMCAQLILQLMPCIIGGEASRYLAMQQTPTIGEYVRLMQTSRAFLDFNVENPTGHYKLDLGNPSDYAVAEQLLLIDRWEAGISLRHNCPDTSQKGNRSQVRNETYQGNEIEKTITNWTLPDYDILELDYSSLKRPPLKAPSLDSITFSNILVVLQQTEIAGLDSTPGSPQYEEAVRKQLEALRRVSHLIFIRSKQLRSMLGIFSEASDVTEVCVMFMNRITDYHNEKVFRIRLKEPQEYYNLCRKVGFLTFFPFIQPEQGVFRWDFAQNDQRRAANVMVCYVIKERTENAKDVSFTKEDGKLDPLPLGIPRSWESIDRMPKAGIFQARYTCSPEDRRVNYRKEMMYKYGNWRCDKSEKQIEWWCDISDTPHDVLEFLTFLSRRFKTTQKAFEYIDGADGNKVVSLREFQEGLRNMQFNKFRGKDEGDRIRTLFRYLDPSGEGQVSESEWEVLNLLWREVQLSIREFVSFLERTLGDDMTEAWHFFDEDGSGEIDFDEWIAATRNVGYFGPVMPIFHFLDADGEGSISADEFIVLEDFQGDEGGSDSDSSME